MPDDVHALRVVHLLGGLRAFDLDGEFIEVGTDEHGPKLRFPRPPYRQLYVHLERLGFCPIGVQMINGPDDLSGKFPPNWKFWKRPGGFLGLSVEQEWAHVRHACLKRGDRVAGVLAGKIRTYLRLVNLRLRQLSDAYNAMLRCGLTLGPGEQQIHPGKFSNMWGDEVEGAIHAYLSEAASLRDALAEACWVLILKRTDRPVSSIGGLIKYAKTTDNAFVGALLRQTDSGGWIKNLTDLRNEVVHVMPVAGMHEHSFADLRTTQVVGGTMYRLHCPLTTADWALRVNVERGVDYSSEQAVRRSVEDYDTFVAASGDALEYAWRTSEQLMSLADSIRRETGLHGEMLTITQADIVPGSFRFISEARS